MRTPVHPQTKASLSKVRARAVPRARRTLLSPLVAGGALPSTPAEFEAPSRRRTAGSGEDLGTFCAPVRGVSGDPTPVLARLPNPEPAGGAEPPLFGILQTSICAGAHLYSAPQHVASAGTLLGRVPATCGSEEPEAMRDPGCGLRRFSLPRTPVNSPHTSPWMGPRRALPSLPGRRDRPRRRR